MEGNDLLNVLPDFDEMNKLADMIADAKARLEDAKNKMDSKVAECIEDYMSDSRYWRGNTKPTMSFANTVVSVQGNTPEDKEELELLRKEIVEYEKIYQRSRRLLDIMKDRISVWQTFSANKRKALG